MIRILFIDDDVNLQKIMKMVLSAEYRFLSAFSGSQGLQKVRDEAPDVVLLDINLPDIDGIKVLNEIKKIPTAPPVVMVSALRETNLIVSAIKAGAYDYIIKSEDDDFEKIRGTVWRAVQNSPDYHNINKGNEALDGIIGESPQINELKHSICSFAPSNAVVLIEGESGTGKELVAAALHKLSLRNKALFLPVNCGAIPQNLVETTLFGSEKGAFTGALSAPGYFEKADKGSLFLDEIGEMTRDTQVKLLRVLETKKIERVGGHRRFHVNVRVIAATNRNLKVEMEEGRFREDLYYRLHVLLIRLPPLRERLSDLPLLAAYFTKSLSENNKKLSLEAVEKLRIHNWPGNIRELKNVLERAVLLTRGDVIKADNIVLY